jgi:hypothetical protein
MSFLIAQWLTGQVEITVTEIFEVICTNPSEDTIHSLGVLAFNIVSGFELLWRYSIQPPLHSLADIHQWPTKDSTLLNWIAISGNRAYLVTSKHLFNLLLGLGSL